MNQSNKVLIAILVVLAAIVATFAYFGFRPGGWFAPVVQPTGQTAATTTSPGPVGTAFSAAGNLVENSPGLSPGIWYLTYEQPGEPAVSVPLAFTPSSRCMESETSRACDPSSFIQGEQATVSGTQASDGTVAVSLLTRASAPSANGDVRVTAPQANAVIASPLAVSGEARGTWFFEAQFPVRIIDANGNELGSSPTHALGDWMTTNFVPFTAEVAFKTPTTATGTLVLEKDNPSGLPQNAAELRIPVRFNATPAASVKLFYYSASKDADASGNIQCSQNGLVAVNRDIPASNTPIQDAIRELLKGQLTSVEKSQGLTTEFPLPGVELTGASLNSGVLTLEFADPQHKLSGGSCRVGILWNEIQATAKQFPGITEVKFQPADLFQP